MSHHWDINSDHNVLSWKIDIDTIDSLGVNESNNGTESTGKKWRVSEMRDWAEFEKKLGIELEEWNVKYSKEGYVSQVEIERMVNEWIECVHNTARRVIGETKEKRGIKGSRVKITGEYKRALEVRRMARKKLARHRKGKEGGETTSELKRDVLKAAKMAKEVKKKEIRKAQSDFMEKMDGSAKGVKEFWKYWASLKKDNIWDNEISLTDENANNQKGMGAAKILTEHLRN